jgi:hypothetical protein
MFVRRQANLVVHALVEAANSLASLCTFEFILLCIEPFSSNEMH